MEDLIGKVLAGEATAEEQRAVEDWNARSEENRRYFQQLETIFKRASSVNVEVQFDADAAWTKVKGRLGRKGKTVSLPATPLWTPLRVAAGLVVMLVGSYLVWALAQPTIITRELSAAKTLTTDTLPDGSLAFLNHKSKLTYRENSREQKRTVALSGEAYFEVRHEEEKPFVIEAEHVLIRDIGTAFNVKAYPESNTVEVEVEEGEVQIYTVSNPGLSLKAGEKGIYDKSLKAFSKIEKIDTNVIAYKTRVFKFNNTDLRSVVALINSVYEANIVLSNEALNDCRLTVNFNNDKLETIVEVLSETMGLTIDQNDSEIILRGTGCSR